ncbi:MAG: sulfur carrier protein ThiS [Methylococcales bacterium]|jgi:sulfur carrier protein|nr:sulfur carrier protein ThiS [Methylococcales bacterium]MBT7410960.1 sulfur carrier protein ThiS [Methylococcales bacterium]
MNIILNGTPKNMSNVFYVKDLITELNLSGKRIAIEINEEIIPRSNYSSQKITDGDTIEVIHAIGGG